MLMQQEELVEQLSTIMNTILSSKDDRIKQVISLSLSQSLLSLLLDGTSTVITPTKQISHQFQTAN